MMNKYTKEEKEFLQSIDIQHVSIDKRFSENLRKKFIKKYLKEFLNKKDKFTFISYSMMEVLYLFDNCIFIKDDLYSEHLQTNEDDILSISKLDSDFLYLNEKYKFDTKFLKIKNSINPYGNSEKLHYHI